jgi:hypothetical protein
MHEAKHDKGTYQEAYHAPTCTEQASSVNVKSFLQNGSPTDALGEQKRLQLSYLHKIASLLFF